MGNMSWCRFQNTLSDLSDCEGAISEGLVDIAWYRLWVDDLSNDEQLALIQLIQLCKDISKNFEDMDEEEIEVWVKNKQEKE